jgi:nucleoside-diphosphate-sugar epimerase
MENSELLYRHLLQPSHALLADMATLEGDILILGVGGKMGPAIARLARQAAEAAGVDKKIIGVSRFSEPDLQKQLNKDGIRTISADLLEDDQLNALPHADNVLYLAGTKFGTRGKESFTWAMNAYLPGRIAQKYKDSRIVAFSTGNVYPLTPVILGGASEDREPDPIGEYAQSCLGRERVFQYYAAKYETPLLIYRLNYANDTSYGVLLEIARSVREGRPIDLSMGNVNVIWQGDANEMAIRSLKHCAVPAKILNVTGPETVSVRWVAGQFGQLFGRNPEFINEEQPTALLSNAAEAFRLFGYPNVGLRQMMELLAAWLEGGGKTINKETHFQERKGKF